MDPIVHVTVQTPPSHSGACAVEGKLRRPSKLSDRPVFIVGAPRSGTTIMCQTIDAHPKIMAPYWETGLFLRCHELLTGHLAWVFQEHRASFPLEREELVVWIRESVEGLFRRLATRCGKSCWAEKTPAHVFHIDLIHEVFPNAQFTHGLVTKQLVQFYLFCYDFADVRVD
jgi:hypothetical protein